MSAYVKTRREGAIFVATIDYPPANAISRRTSRDLYSAFKEFQDDNTLRVAILTGAGDRIFCAGWDLKEANAEANGSEEPLGYGDGGFGGIAQFWGLTKPVIAAINGTAAGGGFEIALACDMIVAVEHAKFMLPESRLGLLPSTGGLQHLHRRVPYNVAMYLMMTGLPLLASEAARWGLVQEIVPTGQALASAIKLAERVCESAPLAIEALKEVMQAASHLSPREIFAMIDPQTTRLSKYKSMRESEDISEGPRAFVEKRKPVWRGR